MENNYNQVPYYGNGIPQQAQTYTTNTPYGFQGQPMSYNQAYYNVKKPGNNQPLTEDEVKELMTKGDLFDWKLTKEAMQSAICAHKHPVTGASTLHELPDGTFECDICKAKFHFFEGTAEDIRNSIENIKDVIQSIKTIYYDAPKEFIASYCQIIPFLEKLDVIWTAAYKNFSDYANYNVMAAPRNMYSYDPWAAFSNMTNNPYASPYQPQAQPYMGQPQQVPQQGYYNPQQINNQQTPPGNFGPDVSNMIMNNNPCTYNPTANMQQPRPSYVPQQPQQQVPQQGQIPQEQTQTVVQTKTMNV